MYVVCQSSLTRHDKIKSRLVGVSFGKESAYRRMKKIYEKILQQPQHSNGDATRCRYIIDDEAGIYECFDGQLYMTEFLCIVPIEFGFDTSVAERR